MEFFVDCTDKVLYVRLSGEVDEHNAAAARRNADSICERFALRAEKVVFDLQGVSFMDSTGIGFLIGRYKKFSKYGIPAYIANPSPATDRILQMSGLYNLMPRI